jgi:hypothetical protein
MPEIGTSGSRQNGFAERLIGSIRRECVDHVVVLREAHLRRILAKCAAYYKLRTHRSLDKDAPIRRAIHTWAGHAWVSVNLSLELERSPLRCNGALGIPDCSQRLVGRQKKSCQKTG